MDVQQAVALAKQYAADLFADDGITDLGLEEARYEYDDGEWWITIGFFQPWNVRGKQPDPPPLFGAAGAEYLRRRTYKIIRLDDKTGSVTSVKDRLLELSE